MTTAVQILRLLTFIVRSLTLQCKISDDTFKSRGTAYPSTSNIIGTYTRLRLLLLMRRGGKGGGLLRGRGRLFRLHLCVVVRVLVPATLTDTAQAPWEKYTNNIHILLFHSIFFEEGVKKFADVTYEVMMSRTAPDGDAESKDGVVREGEGACPPPLGWRRLRHHS